MSKVIQLRIALKIWPTFNRHLFPRTAGKFRSYSYGLIMFILSMGASAPELTPGDKKMSCGGGGWTES